MSICHVPFSVYQFWASQVQCESLPCWATEWALGSVNSTRWKGLGPGILHSLSRYSLDNPSKFFPLYCPSKISQCCLERNIWRVRKEFLFCYLVLAGHHWDLGAVIDVAGKQIFPRESCVKETHKICQVEVTFCKMGLLARSLLSSDGLVSVLFGLLGDQLSSALCLSISGGGLGDWLSATQSIPLELIPLEQLHSWLSCVAPYGNH